eukprot:comp22127_c0_seq1/m.32366 comp22127_c0_seq1/g.32366  ORF comp22127_c0_seq1/g.32366 comp22127_c0_seq1/m.32366 type:complete len:493 (-) comp22127_c0_seq1:566-2044(-)
MKLLQLNAAVCCAVLLILAPSVVESRTVTVYDDATGEYFLADSETGKIIGPASGETPTTTTKGEKPKKTATPSADPTQSADAGTSSGKCGSGCQFSIGSTCYKSIGDAVNAASTGATINIADGSSVTGEVAFTRSLSFVGCGTSGRARVNVDMNADQGAVLRATGDHQKIAFKKLSWVGSGMTRYSSVLRTPDLGDGEFPRRETTGPVSLTVDDCDFSNFKTLARGGAVFFLGKTGTVSISNSEFSDNRVGTIGKDRYEGGGAIWFNRLSGKATVTDTVFKNNVHEFGHGVGSGFMILDMSSKSSLTMNGVRFEGNKADSGAGLYIKNIPKGATVVLNADFMNNECIFSKDFGCRGGASWLQNIGGDVTITGTYSGNQAIGDRAGAIANNRIFETGRVTIDAKFTDNKSTKGGAIWDTMYALHKGGVLTFKSSTVMEGNIGEGGKDIVIRILNDEKSNPGGRTIIRYQKEWNASGKTWEFVGSAPFTGAVEN